MKIPSKKEYNPNVIKLYDTALINEGKAIGYNTARAEMLEWMEKELEGMEIGDFGCNAEEAIDNLLKRIREDNICDTAPYPKCNGAEGCDTCEHQLEE